MTKKTFVVAIDPGASGAVAYMVDGKLIGVEDFNPVSFVSTMARFVHDVVIVEDVWPSPAQGVNNAFSFGRALGKIDASLELLGIEPWRVGPKNWQSMLGLIGAGKEGIRQYAEKVFKREFNRQDHADAALMALYANIVRGTGLQKEKVN